MCSAEIAFGLELIEPWKSEIVQSDVDSLQVVHIRYKLGAALDERAATVRGQPIVNPYRM